MGESCAELANACRIASDVRYWGTGVFGTAKAVNIMSFAARFNGPGHWADPDLLFSFQAVGDPTKTPAEGACPANGAGHLAWCTGSFCDPVVEHSRAQFTIWAVRNANYVPC
jgi:hypothetical protein